MFSNGARGDASPPEKQASFSLSRKAAGFAQADRRFLHDARENITLFRGRINIFSKILFWAIYKINWLYISVACVIKCRQVCFKCIRSVRLSSCTVYHVGEHARVHARMHACSCIENCFERAGLHARGPGQLCFNLCVSSRRGVRAYLVGFCLRWFLSLLSLVPWREYQFYRGRVRVCARDIRGFFV